MGGFSHEIRGFIESRDHALMRTVHRWIPPKWFRSWMILATRGGDGWLWLSLGAVLLLFGGTQGMHVAAQSSLACGIGICVFLGLKRITGRRRPCELEPHCWSTLLPPDQFSFPSGHAITAFAIVTPVLQSYPEATTGLLFAAASVAVSRIVLGMHFLSDVLAGIGIGFLVGGLAQFLL